ncbi:hypothetical protein NPIL_554131 [Nephila pilipes]|uniref:Uncharacterized protein n=1 Tax=Nephila pilipes TaxID=299642 RepID=A0A8X6PM53_NEPPI|nr:hypothetical protein NPIL_554131 [Nephila pilipes]
MMNDRVSSQRGQKRMDGSEPGASRIPKEGLRCPQPHSSSVKNTESCPRGQEIQDVQRIDFGSTMFLDAFRVGLASGVLMSMGCDGFIGLGLFSGVTCLFYGAPMLKSTGSGMIRSGWNGSGLLQTDQMSE